MEKTKIEWCDSTFNPWIGCTKVGPGCDHCYAEADFDLRKHRVKWGTGNPRSRTSVANWKKPLQWNKRQFFACRKCGWRGELEQALGFRPTGAVTLFAASCRNCGGAGTVSPCRRRVFCASLADVFDNEVPAQWREDLFRLVEMTPNLDWLLLTKRIGNAAPMMFAARGGHLPLLAHVWLGATICNQEEADRDIPKLLRTPATVRWISAEPLLGALDLSPWLDIYQYEDGDIWRPRNLSRPISSPDWVVVGGESGSNARPMRPEWARALRDQCAGADVPLLFKQWGEFAPYDRGAVDGSALATKNALDLPMQRFGKKLAGRLLDGKLHDDYPETNP